MLLWCLQHGYTALIRASGNGHIDVVKYLIEHKANVNAKNRVITALTVGLFDSWIDLLLCDAAMVSAVWLHIANGGLTIGPN